MRGGAERWPALAAVIALAIPLAASFDAPTSVSADDGRRQIVFDVEHRSGADHADLIGPVRPRTDRLLDPSPGVLLAGMNPVAPGRVLDTRDGTGVPTPGTLGAGASLDLVVGGRQGLPAAGVDTVALNVTVTGASAPTFLTVWPTGVDRPVASSLNAGPGQTVANLVFAKVGDGGAVSIFNGFGDLHVVADVVGWSASEEFLHALTPTRILDTRDGTGVATPGTVGAAGRVDLQVTGDRGVPAAGVGAVVLNVTVTQATAPSFVTVWPTGSERPLASSLNTLPGETNPNLVIAKVGDGGKVSLFNAAGRAHLVADVVGWLPVGGAYTAISPTRVMDSRDGTGIYGTFVDDPMFGRILRPGQLDPDQRLQPGETVQLQVSQPLGLPRSATAVLLNLTGTEATEPTFVTAWGAGDLQPFASSLNLLPGATRPNLVLAELGDDGFVSLFNSAGAVHLVADVVGWFEARNADDAVDEVAGEQVHVVHVVPSDVTSTYGDAEIAHVLDVAERWLEDHGDRGIRFDTVGGEPEITTLHMAKTAAEIVDAADPYSTDWDDWIAADGLGTASKAYIVFVEGAPTGSLCGLGGNGQARVFTSSCFPEDSGSVPNTTGTWRTLTSARTALHELMHVLGAVSTCSPGGDGNGHVVDIADLMYPTQFITFSGALDPAYGNVVDTGRDDYWGQGDGECPFDEPWPDLSLSPYLDEPR